MKGLAVAEVLDQAGAVFLERGWLSSNNVLFRHGECNALVDSGYSSHAQQTLALVEHALSEQPLHLLLNTHLHSDHCGGNAQLQARYPDLKTFIPPGQSDAVTQWDEGALTYRQTGQSCSRFTHTGLLTPGSVVRLGPMDWEVHSAKGHDPHAVVLFQPDLCILISADALWGNGFGVVFPELEGVAAFDEVAETLDLIAQLAPQTVIPGHGPIFQDVESALERARSRLQQFRSSPAQHRRYAMKVLIKFRLLEWQRIPWHDLRQWALQTPYLADVMPKEAHAADAWLSDLLSELAHAQAIDRRGDIIYNR